MNKILFEKTHSTVLQFIRYIFVGGFAAVVDTGTLYVLYHHLDVNHLAAAAVGFLLGLLVNYFISIAWVFDTTGNIRQELGLFALIGIGGLGWTELILWLAHDVLHAPVMAGKVVALALVLLWNFGMRKKFVFATPKPAGLPES